MKTGFAGILIGLCAATQVAAQSDPSALVLRQIQQCIAETRAPGSYQVAEFDAVPVVVANQGGTTRSAHNVNDCLQDNYNVQYSVGSYGLKDSNEVEAIMQSCRKKVSGQLVLGTVLTAGTAIALGASTGGGVAFGLLVGATGSSALYDRCLRKAGVSENSGLQFASGCSRRSDVMHGGSQYCR